MVTVLDDGTQSGATVGSSEHTLVDNAAANTYVLVVSTANMVNGDELELKCQVKVLSSGGYETVFIRRFRNVQIENIKFSPPIPAGHSFKATLKQVTGTARNFDWSVLTLG